MKSIIIAAILSLSFGALAEDACKADRQAHCATEMKSHEGLLKCMHHNEAKLSEACKAQRKEKLQDAKKVRQACKEDRKKFCPNKSRREVFKCMKENAEQLSAECKAEIKEFVQ